MDYKGNWIQLNDLDSNAWHVYLINMSTYCSKSWAWRLKFTLNSQNLIVIFWGPALLKNVMNLRLTVNKCWYLYKQHLAIITGYLAHQATNLLFVYVCYEAEPIWWSHHILTASNLKLIDWNEMNWIGSLRFEENL